MNRRTMMLALAGMLIVACTCPAIAATGSNTPATASPGAPSATTAPLNAATATSTAGSLTPTACTPTLTATSNVNVRSGPGTVYNEVGFLNANQTAPIDGKNSEGTWWYIVYGPGPGGHGWVAASVSTATCVSGSIAVVVPPATVTPEIPLGVTNVSVSVEPKEIHIAGCMGPLQQSTVVATITVNGPITLKWHFETDQHGSLGNQTLTFDAAGSKQVSAKFTPLASAGTYQVRIVIDNMDLGGMDFQAKYKVIC